jgi:hypothetical protein
MNSNPATRHWHPLEYAHVFMWLIKDLCWAQNWVELGAIMVVPTILVAFVITWLLRDKLVNLVHNMAISIWITSNSAWMLAEFYQVEPTLKPVAIAGFYAGIMLLVGYYLLMGYRSWQAKS